MSVVDLKARLPSAFTALAGRLAALLGRNAHVLEFEPEIADACEQSVELRLVSELPDELGATRVAHWRHALDSARQATAQLASHDDPCPGGSHRLARRLRCVHESRVSAGAG
jgi:hypothetical protein